MSNLKTQNYNMFDTHCHLNFKSFRKTLSEVVNRAHKVGVSYMLIPGTDIETSRKAVEIAEKFDGVYAAVGIHPHHVYESRIKNREYGIQNIEDLLKNRKVIAVGEVGIDKHVYEETKYGNYEINGSFLKNQKELLIEQIQLAIQYKKSLILHNREATDDMVSVLSHQWDKQLEGRTVFHCCEPDERLLMFAKEHRVYIGVDGDITYDKKKQEFVKHIPLELLVLETDSPFLLPEPLRSQKKYPNEPANLPMISCFISAILEIPEETFNEATNQNSKLMLGL